MAYNQPETIQLLTEMSKVERKLNEWTQFLTIIDDEFTTIENNKQSADENIDIFVNSPDANQKRDALECARKDVAKMKNGIENMKDSLQRFARWDQT